ncbi:Uncharacterized protein HZ326_11973 [Fusarium oxysporum f. sp. albedinis]|nr:Uncharacterized protein HZ326_11973 [Fusarium oxysporum f. sp. albedinis]
MPMRIGRSNALPEASTDGAISLVLGSKGPEKKSTPDEGIKGKDAVQAPDQAQDPQTNTPDVPSGIPTTGHKMTGVGQGASAPPNSEPNQTIQPKIAPPAVTQPTKTTNTTAATPIAPNTTPASEPKAQAPTNPQSTTTGNPPAPLQTAP